MRQEGETALREMAAYTIWLNIRVSVIIRIRNDKAVICIVHSTFYFGKSVIAAMLQSCTIGTMVNEHL